MTTISQLSHLDIIIQSEKVTYIPVLGKIKLFQKSPIFFFPCLLISHTPIPTPVIGKDKIPFSLPTAVRNWNPISPNFLKISNELFKKRKERKETIKTLRKSRKLKYSLRFGETFICCSVPKSCLTLLRHHGLWHSRLPCPSPSPRVYSNSCPLSQ